MKKFASRGWTPFRSTLLNILTASAVLIHPLVEYFADEVRKDGVIGTEGRDAPAGDGVEKRSCE